MAKKRTNQPVEETPASPYITVTWKTKELYKCPLCRYDSFVKLDMLKHLVNKHNNELALVELVKLEEETPSPSPSPIAKEQEPQLEMGKGDVFEVELVETDSIVDAQGTEHKTFTVKE